METIQSQPCNIIKPAPVLNNRTRVSFCALENSSCDVFEKKGGKIPVRLWDPYAMEMFRDRVSVDRNKSQNIVLEMSCSDGKKNVVFNYDPSRIDTLKNRATGAEIETVILKSDDPNNKDRFTYHMMSDDLLTEYGFVCLSKHAGKKSSDSNGGDIQNIFKFLKSKFPYSEPLYRQDIFADYEKQGIKGDRVEIEYVQNVSPANVSGVGVLADKLAVKYCLENQIEPNIVFYSMNNEHIKNFQRGNRFLPLDKNTKTARYFREKYGSDNPNEVMEMLLKKGKLSKSVTEYWGDLAMYIPKQTVDEYSNDYKQVKLKIESPFKSNDYYSSEFYIDMKKPRKFTMTNESNQELVLDFDPKRKGTLIDKRTNSPIKAYILHAKDDDYYDEDAFVFVSEDLSKEYGYVELDKGYESYTSDLECDYPEQGIRGDKVIVAYLMNKDKCKVGGVGKLADRVAVKYCLENNIDPRCIISHAAEGSHVAHYKRGKRFIPPSKRDESYYILKKRYGETNPNKILKRLIKDSDENGEPVDIKGWGELDLVMFLPKEIIDKYSKEGIQ